MPKTKLEEIVESMIALKRVTSPTGIISDRAKRNYDESSQEAYEKLKREKKLDGVLVGSKLTWKDTNIQKGMALGIREFEQKYPEHGKILRDIIATHRKGRRAHIEFYLQPGRDLPKEFYRGVIMSLGDEFTSVKSEKLYGALKEFWDKLGREKEGRYSVLLNE